MNVYNQMAQVLVGYDHTGSIREFDEDGNFIAGGTKLKEIMCLNFSRLLCKDEIKKGSFSMTVHTAGAYGSPVTELTLTDSGSTTSYLTNSPAGEYGILYDDSGSKYGLVYYQAYTAVLSASVFTGTSFGTGSEGIETVFTETAISGCANDLRHRIKNISFNNTTELNSRIYFCRADHNSFNYSSSPTFLSGSQLVVKNFAQDDSVAYITSVGLYSASNELLALAKLSEPLKKQFGQELTIRCRIDF